MGQWNGFLWDTRYENVSVRRSVNPFERLKNQLPLLHPSPYIKYVKVLAKNIDYIKYTLYRGKITIEQTQRGILAQ